MKKYLLFLLATIVFVACTPNEVDDPSHPQLNSKCIYYTATAKVESDPYDPWTFDTFGANVVFNEWDSITGEGVITFDADVTTIGNYSFINCFSLISITIPDSVMTIADGAFCNCRNLQEFNGKFASDDGKCLIVNGILNSFAIGCGATEYTIPDSVTTIGKQAFSSCSSLTSVTIPDSVTTIETAAFSNCDNLTNITIPNGVTTIGSSAFYKCSSLTSITIPDSVTTIGTSPFAYCGNLAEFNGKFASDDGRCLIVDGTLNSFAPAELTSYTIPDGVTTIGDCAFYYCLSITTITIPNSVTTIGNEAFVYCITLTDITIPDGVTTIGYGAFCGCQSLHSITIPDSVTIIDIATFLNCSSLANVIIGNSVTTIEERAFAFCSNLISIIIPNNVTTIGSAAFYECLSLTSVYCEAITPPSLGNKVFDNNALDRKIYIPTESVDAYRAANGWSDYADAIVGYDFEKGEIVE